MLTYFVYGGLSQPLYWPLQDVLGMNSYQGGPTLVLDFLQQIYQVEV